jgi:hypothetical protein
MVSEILNGGNLSTRAPGELDIRLTREWRYYVWEDLHACTDERVCRSRRLNPGNQWILVDVAEWGEDGVHARQMTDSDRIRRIIHRLVRPFEPARPAGRNGQKGGTSSRGITDSTAELVFHGRVTDALRQRGSDRRVEARCSGGNIETGRRGGIGLDRLSPELSLDLCSLGESRPDRMGRKCSELLDCSRPVEANEILVAEALNVPQGAALRLTRLHRVDGGCEFQGGQQHRNERREDAFQRLCGGRWRCAAEPARRWIDGEG